MAIEPAGNTQVRAFRFATRQREWALTQGDPLVQSDPGQLPRRWTVVSFFLALVLCAGFAVFGLIKPAPNWRDSALILETDSGTLYVNRNGVLYPALNLTSALLASDSSSSASSAPERTRPTPKKVFAVDIADAPRGALLGIPGAPTHLPAADQLVPELWGACDEIAVDDNRAKSEDHAVITSTVTVGQATPGTVLTGTQALLARSSSTDAAGVVSEVDFLIWNGHRSRIDPSNPVIAEALQLAGASPRALSVGLLNAIPEQAPIVVPAVTGEGTATSGFSITAGASGGTRKLAVGDVFKVVRAGGVTFHVVHTDGVEQISATVADLLRFQRSLSADIPPVLPSVLAVAPPAKLELIDSTALPPVVPELITTGSAPLVCAGWDGSGTQGPHWAVSAGTGIPATAPMVTLAGTSPQAGVARVMVQPAHGAVVREYVAGQPAGQQTRMYLISDLGVAYPVAGTEVLARLGFPTSVPQAPKQVLDLLPRGPVLDIGEASQLWDSFPDSMLAGSASAVSGAPPSNEQAPITEYTVVPTTN